jgi:hypothetical protein
MQEGRREDQRAAEEEGILDKTPACQLHDGLFGGGKLTHVFRFLC